MKFKIAIIVSLIWISHNSFAQSNSGIASANMEEELLDQYDDELKSKSSKSSTKQKNTTSRQKINYQQRRWKTVKREIQKNKEALGDRMPKKSEGSFDTIYLKLPSKIRDKVITSH